jgi:uncharacterized protein YjbI with pentapeptide repeats
MMMMTTMSAPRGWDALPEELRPVAEIVAERIRDGMNKAKPIKTNFRSLGGSGSGNFGHTGRPGEVGGSADGENNQQAEVWEKWTTEKSVVDLYHVTLSENLKSIEREGFTSKKNSVIADPVDTDRIFFATEREQAESIKSQMEQEQGASAAVIHLRMPARLLMKLDPRVDEAMPESSIAVRPSSKLHRDFFLSVESSEGDVPEKWKGRSVEKRPRVLGGSGSGNFGHVGRPGEVGGSGEQVEFDIQSKDWRVNSVKSKATSEISRITKMGFSFPDLRVRIKDGVLGADRVGDYEDGTIQLGTKQESRFGEVSRKFTVGEGRSVVDASPAGVIRHEVGHHIESNYRVADSSFADAVKQGMSKEGLDFSKSSDRRAFLSDSISTYASSNLEEAFCEAFCAYTHQNYGETTNRLPSEIEKVFEELATRSRSRKDNVFKSLGGTGSGNFGHAGRPGEVGGSADEHGASDNVPTVVESATISPDDVAKLKGKLVGCKLVGDFRGKVFDGVSFEDCDLTAATIDGAEFNKCVFSKTKLPAKIQDARFIGGVFHSDAISGTTLTKCELSGVTFDGRVKRLMVDEGMMMYCNFSGSTIIDSNFQGVTMEQVSFVGASLSGVAMTTMQFNECNFSRLDSKGEENRIADSEFRSDCTFFKTNLSAMVMNMCRFGNSRDLAEFRECQFENTEMNGCTLTAVISDSSFLGATVADSYLEGRIEATNMHSTQIRKCDVGTLLLHENSMDNTSFLACEFDGVVFDENVMNNVTMKFGHLKEAEFKSSEAMLKNGTGFVGGLTMVDVGGAFGVNVEVPDGVILETEEPSDDDPDSSVASFVLAKPVPIELHNELETEISPRTVTHKVSEKSMDATDLIAESFTKVMEGDRSPADLKDEIVKKLSDDLKKAGVGMDEKKVNATIKTWARSSGDHDQNSWNFQCAVWKEMLSEAGELHAPEEFVDKSLQNSEDLRPLVRAMYSNTQAKLKEIFPEGTTHVTLYRGFKFDVQSPVYGDEVKFDQNPATSWSFDPKVAAKFGREQSGIGAFMTASVPIECILSTALSGSGCWKEGEVIALRIPGSTVRIGKTVRSFITKGSLKKNEQDVVLNIDSIGNDDWIKFVTNMETSTAKTNFKALGGSGSGNFGHAGRPGEVGGSGPGIALGRVKEVVDGERKTFLTDKRTGKKLPEEWQEVRGQVLSYIKSRCKAEWFPDDDPPKIRISTRTAEGTKRIYTKKYEARRGVLKFRRSDKLVNSGVRQKILDNGNKTDDDNSRVLQLIAVTGLRPGSEASAAGERGDVATVGAVHLSARHVRVTANETVLRFRGKGGKMLDIAVPSKSTASMLRERARLGGRLFPEAKESELPDLLRRVTNIDGVQTKDLRTSLATSIAAKAVSAYGGPTNTEKEILFAIRSVANKVSNQLGNTPAMALKRYINPAVFAKWHKKGINL